MSQATEITPFFLDSPRGPLFCMYTAPIEAVVVSAVLYMHPFAEEMHKSRRMAALQTRALAKAGFAVLQVDLTGCGDSAGDFGDATWQAWQDDVRAAHAWLRASNPAPITLWGLRTGATLAADIASELHDLHHLLLWQPVASGDVFLNQFLRIKLASEMLADGQAQSGTKALRELLAKGEGVEVGGYMLSPDMARQMGAIKLAEKQPNVPVTWLEVGTEASATLSPGSQRIAEAWRQAGIIVTAETIPGDPFWATQEISESHRLIERTLAIITSMPSMGIGLDTQRAVAS